MVFILRDKDYFNVPHEQLGNVSNDLIFYPVLCSLFVSFVVGYLYDIYGRIKTIITSCLFSAILVFLIPFTAPHVLPWLMAVRILIGCTFIVPNSNPLVNDYVQK